MLLPDPTLQVKQQKQYDQNERGEIRLKQNLSRSSSPFFYSHMSFRVSNTISSRKHDCASNSSTSSTLSSEPVTSTARPDCDEIDLFRRRIYPGVMCIIEKLILILHAVLLRVTHINFRRFSKTFSQLPPPPSDSLWC